jgi:hypothetical protein
MLQNAYFVFRASLGLMLLFTFGDASFCIDWRLWYGRFSLRERFITSRSRRARYATSVRLDDQCVWARAIDVSWPPLAQAGRGACCCAF